MLLLQIRPQPIFSGNLASAGEPLSMAKIHSGSRAAHLLRARRKPTTSLSSSAPENPPPPSGELIFSGEPLSDGKTHRSSRAQLPCCRRKRNPLAPDLRASIPAMQPSRPISTIQPSMLDSHPATNGRPRPSDCCQRRPQARYRLSVGQQQRRENL
ncbi:hypothetical protein ACLOJK_002243 [Asimina triloba]